MSSPGRQAGFSLIELLLVVAITGVIGSLIGTSISMVINITTDGNDALRALHAHEKGTRIIGEDAQMASSTDLVDSAPPVSSATLTWSDEYETSSTSHTVSYSLSGTDLQRNYDGAVTTVAKDVSSIGFSRCGNELTVDLIAVSKQLSYTFILRPSTDAPCP